MKDRPGDYRNEIEFIQDVISKHFPVYKTEIEFDKVAVYIKAPSEDILEDKFDKLRKEFVPQNYVPRLVEKHGEHIIKVKKQEEKKFRSVKANIAMLFITLGTTLIAGAWWWSNYDPAGAGMISLHNLANGALYFTLPLLLILGTHEMGHYIMARYHGIKASLPFFLPMAPPLGTIGAFISIREPIPDKKSLLDIGIAGPITGFVVAIPVTVIGLYLGSTTTPTAPVPIEGVRQIWHFPIIMKGMARFLPWAGGETIHPTLFAGWVGFLVTGLNLLPASQLDGGHVIRSLFGDYAKYISYVAFGFLFIVGIWEYRGWIVFAVLILFLGGIKHPPPLNDMTNLDRKRLVVGGVAILILFVSFHPIPIKQENFSYGFQVELEEEAEQKLILGESFNYTLTVENQAKNVDIDQGIEYEVSYSLSNETWDARLWTRKQNNWTVLQGNQTKVTLDIGENRTYKLQVRPTKDSNLRTDITFKAVTNVTGKKQVKKKSMTAKIGEGYRVDLISDRISLIKKNETSFEFSLLNKGTNDSYRLWVENVSDENWTVRFENISGRETELDFAEKLHFSAILELKENRSVNRKDELTVIRAQIAIKSEDTGRVRKIDLMGIRVNEGV